MGNNINEVRARLEQELSCTRGTARVQVTQGDLRTILAGHARLQALHAGASEKRGLDGTRTPADCPSCFIALTGRGGSGALVLVDAREIAAVMQYQDGTLVMGRGLGDGVVVLESTHQVMSKWTEATR